MTLFAVGFPAHAEASTIPGQPSHFIGYAVAFSLGIAVALALAFGPVRRRLSARASQKDAALLAAENDLKVSRERLELALSGAGLGSWDWSPVTFEAHYDRRWAEMLGHTLEEIEQMNSSFEDRIHPADRQATFEKINAHLRGETDIYEAELRLRAKDGSWRWVQTRGRVTGRDPDGRATRMSGTHLDITEKKRAEMELRQSETWLRLLTSSIRAVIWEVDIDQDSYTYVSPQIETFAGYSVEEWSNHDVWRKRLHPKDRDRVLAEYDEVLHRGAAYDLEYRLLTKDDRVIWIRDLIGIENSLDGRRIARGLMIDVTDARNAAEALRESEARHLSAERVAQLSHWTAKQRPAPNEDNPWLMFSETGSLVLGVADLRLTISLEDYVGRFVEAEDRARVLSQLRPATHRGEDRGGLEYRIQRGDGREAFILQICRYEFDERGQFISGFGTIQDITIRKQAERAMAEARREAEAASLAKTQFLANTSHELRTPLNAIIGFSDLMRNELLGPLGNAAYRQYSADIHSSGQHLLSIINDLLDLSRVESGQTKLHEEIVDVQTLIASCTRLIESRAAERNVAVISPPVATNPWIVADARQIRQALINLLANAVKFTPAGGTIRVEAAPVADGFEISVIDTGIGMTEEEVARAVKPFVQIENWLARKYEGVGLGLSITKSYCELHGGELRIESRPGHGTRATIWLPRSRIPAPASAAGSRR